MSRRTQYAIISAALLLWAMFTLYLWQCLERPYERPPAPTKAEERRIKGKRLGNFTLIYCVRDIYIVRDGTTEWLMRRIP